MAQLPVAKTPRSLLIIGDMVVDDCWVVGEYKSPTATHVGRSHYRSLHHSGSAVKQHCGAGRVAGILSQARLDEPGERFASDVHVLGVWADTDTDGYLGRMFVPHNLMGSNSHRIVAPPKAAMPSRVHLHNFGTALPALGYKQFSPPAFSKNDPIAPFINIPSHMRHFDKYYGTTRVFRLYKRLGNRLEQLGRLDWELSPQTSEDAFPSWIPSTINSKQREAIATSLEAEFRNTSGFDAVIVKDNGKGVVSTALLQILLEDKRFQHLKLMAAPWFIHTKRWQPEYLGYLQQSVPIHLLVYHNVALRTYHSTKTWITSQGKVTRDAIEELRNVHDRCSKDVSRRLCVLQPGAFNAVVVATKGNNSELAFQPQSNPNNITLEGTTGSATAMFSSLVYGMLQQPDKRKGVTQKDVISTRALLDGALRVAQYWTEIEYDRLLHSDTLTPPEELVLSLIEPNEADEKDNARKIALLKPAADMKSLIPQDISAVGHVRGFTNMKPELSRWEHSLQGCAWIKESPTGEAFIEISRSSIELNNYACLAPARRAQIAGLMDAVKRFDPRQNKSMSALVIARPGSGKTMLVNGLAADLGLQMLSYNITNMMRIEDLLHCFDQIVTAQAESRNHKLLVFIDEINAHIDGQPVYEAFLTPLEDGYYVRSGTKRFIRPCIWIFVGTATLAKISRNMKGSDFISRLAIEPVTIRDVPENEIDYLYTENIYVGIISARKDSPRLGWLHADVLRVLGALGREVKSAGGRRVHLGISNREIKQLVARELYVDGAGRGTWRTGLNDVCERHSRLINEAQLKRNERSLISVGEWIRIYDNHPDYVAR